MELSGRAVVEDESPMRRSDGSVEQFHRSAPTSDDPILGHGVTTLRNAKGNALNIGIWIIDSDEE